MYTSTVKSGSTKEKLWGHAFELRGCAIKFYNIQGRWSGDMHFGCLCAKHVFYFAFICIGDGSTLIPFLVLKCLCFCFLGYLVCKFSSFVGS